MLVMLLPKSDCLLLAHLQVATKVDIIRRLHQVLKSTISLLACPQQKGVAIFSNHLRNGHRRRESCPSNLVYDPSKLLQTSPPARLVILLMSDLGYPHDVVVTFGNLNRHLLIHRRRVDPWILLGQRFWMLRG